MLCYNITMTIWRINFDSTDRVPKPWREWDNHDGRLAILDHPPPQILLKPHTFTEWHPSGSKRSVNHLLHNNVRTGWQVQWYDTGQIMSYRSYVNGIVHGEHLRFNPDGSLFKNFYIVDGEEVSDSIAVTEEEKMFIELKYGIKHVPGELLFDRTI